MRVFNKFFYGCMIGVLLILTGACSNDVQQVAEIPTEFVLPSQTPSDTPTSTLTPTTTLTPTNTSTTTNTPTLTPTASVTASLTFTPSTTPTFTLTPTDTATNTPPASATPTATATSAQPQILSFTASTTTGAPGTSITLTWQSVADGARIEQLNTQGAIVQALGTVTPSGSLPVTLPSGQGNQVIYRLVAGRGGQEVSSSLPITLTCQISWFFGDQFAPAGSGCPTAVGTVASGAFQPFERGVMIFLASNNKVYGLQNQNNQFLAYTSTWDGTTTYNCAGTPPGGLFAAQGVLDWAYCNTLGSGGLWKDLLGWASTNIDGSTRTFQLSDTGAFFIDAPGGAVYRFSGGDSGTWIKVK